MSPAHGIEVRLGPKERPWLASYPPGVPHEIDARAFPSLKPLFEASFVRFASHPAFRSFGSVLTYSEIDRVSAAFGAWLQHEAGLSRGDRVALVLPNILAFPAAFIGALRAGIAVVPMNPLSPQRELAFQLADSGAMAVVVLDSRIMTKNYGKWFLRSIPKCRITDDREELRKFFEGLRAE